ncbi:MAG: Abi family protein [Bacillota bacterium]|nr:Abi family protein [Bacillota bacterium]
MCKNHIEPTKTIDEQIQAFILQGLHINDVSRAEAILLDVNYYRLSAYAYNLHETPGFFIPGTTIEQLYMMHQFDSSFGLLLLGQIIPVELKLRSVLVNVLSLKHGNAAHTDISIVATDKHKEFLAFLAQYYEGLAKSLDQAFVTLNLADYGELPLWAAVETMTLGMVSRLYGILNSENKRAIADHFKCDPKRLPTWLHLITTARNICAHSGRIYNRHIALKPRLYPELEKYNNPYIYKVLLVLKLLRSNTKETSDFIADLDILFEKYGQDIDKAKLGFPKYWKSPLLSPSPHTPNGV